MGKFKFKSYCWNLGTTSFRTENFNRTIELQLDLLDRFWKLPQNRNGNWSEKKIQESYYDFLKENSFIKGDAVRKDKDAREKVSGLYEIGLINKDRKLTNAGIKALRISQKGDFSKDNKLQISKDSFLYLKQLLKTSSSIDSEIVRPLIVTLYILSNHGFLNYDEFTYLLPLCTNKDYTQLISHSISSLRSNKIGIDEIIIDRLLSMQNYREALEWFLSLSSVGVDDILEIGMNRKSSQYDIPYYEVYLALKNVFLDNNKDENSLLSLFMAIKKLKLKTWWNNFIFVNNTSEKKIKRELEGVLVANIFSAVTDEIEFRVVFFKTMHLFKVKSTLKDYFDLNCRYFGLSDILLFRDSKVELDIIPKHFFNSIIHELYSEAYLPSNVLESDCKLHEISPALKLDDNTIINSINSEFGLNISNLVEAMDEYDKQRYIRFNKLIDEKFSDKKLIELLEQFENRDDSNIREYITNNADIPTIFEYVLGIVWYKISERKGKILDYMKLSLDADFFPKSHAAGGEADIVYVYNETIHYPKHTLLLEATLTDKTNQRRMELEPVSRHLGQHLLKTDNNNSYCVFVTTHLDINVISDFRSRKILPYYDTNNSSKRIKGMKITTLEIKELKSIITSNKKYSELYSIFDKAYKADLHDLEADEWYQKYIVEKL